MAWGHHLSVLALKEFVHILQHKWCCHNCIIPQFQFTIYSFIQIALPFGRITSFVYTLCILIWCSCKYMLVSFLIIIISTLLAPITERIEYNWIKWWIASNIEKPWHLFDWIYAIVFLFIMLHCNLSLSLPLSPFLSKFRLYAHIAWVRLHMLKYWLFALWTKTDVDRHSPIISCKNCVLCII